MRTTKAIQLPSRRHVSMTGLKDLNAFICPSRSGMQTDRLRVAAIARETRFDLQHSNFRMGGHHG